MPRMPIPSGHRIARVRGDQIQVGDRYLFDNGNHFAVIATERETRKTRGGATVIEYHVRLEDDGESWPVGSCAPHSKHNVIRKMGVAN